VFALAGAALLLASCAPPPPPPPLSIDPRVAVRPDAGVIVANPLTISRTATGITHVSIELRSQVPRDLAVSCAVDWFNADSQPAGGLSAYPTRVAVPAYGAAFCETVSPNPGATQFRAAITPTN
jgi:hypothetical protein